VVVTVMLILPISDLLGGAAAILNSSVELFFCKKIPLSRHIGYVMDRSMDG